MLSIVVHLGSILTLFYAAKAYASPEIRIPTAAEFFAVTPIVNTLVSLPISLGGVGVRAQQGGQTDVDSHGRHATSVTQRVGICSARVSGGELER